ncbi:hypothetical protein [Rhodococcus sp. NPDC060176]|uniref:hypothetical protein n=1 Tax=Rhodococcus sp. NPDC060176 TaxID=3347062 RepID=UPI00366818CF
MAATFGSIALMVAGVTVAVFAGTTSPFWVVAGLVTAGIAVGVMFPFSFLMAITVD